MAPPLRVYLSLFFVIFPKSTDGIQQIEGSDTKDFIFLVIPFRPSTTRNTEQHFDKKIYIYIDGILSRSSFITKTPLMFSPVLN